MDVRAILLIGGKAEASSEHFTGVPLAMLDLLGASLLNRVTHRMHQQGINSIAVISEYDQFPDRHLSHDLRWFKATNGQFWRFAEAVFNDFAQNGAELIVVLRLSSNMLRKMNAASLRREALITNRSRASPCWSQTRVSRL